jgi:hypothetical protein
LCIISWTTLQENSRSLHHNSLHTWWWSIRPKHVVMYNKEKKTSEY